jgi:hypothetical protein
MKKLVMPKNCIVVPADSGTVSGFIGAEVFRKATDRWGTTSTRAENDTTSDARLKEATNSIKPNRRN